MNNRRIGILGGSFDPPTLAHEKLGEIFIQELGLDEVRYVVARQNPLKVNKATGTADNRMDMLKMMIQGHEKFSVSDAEIQDETTPSYAYNTMKMFELCEPHSEFIFLGGSDILTKFYQWYKAEQFIKEFKFAIAIRPPHNKTTTISRIKESDRKNITIVEQDSMPDISSTDVRTFFEDGDLERARQLMRPDLFDYIVDNKLYKIPQAPSVTS
jgi:nicotinate-nucleotide adenylyltransferase